MPSATPCSRQELLCWIAPLKYSSSYLGQPITQRLLIWIKPSTSRFVTDNRFACSAKTRSTIPNCAKRITSDKGRPFLWDNVCTLPRATYPDGEPDTAPTGVIACANSPALPSLFGLAPGVVCHAVSVAGPAVRSYRTFSPLLPLPLSLSRKRGG
jgi:hypothetical protein